MVRTREGDPLVSARAAETSTSLPAKVHAVAWSPDGSYIAARENDVVRLHRASDLAVIAEEPDVAVGQLAFGPSLEESDERAHEVIFDPWRERFYALTDRGISVRSPSGELLSTWRIYKGRAGMRATHLAVSATFLATIGDGRRSARTIDLWDPLSFRPLASFDMPDDAAPTWMVSSPDGAVLVTGADHGLRLWNVAARIPGEHPAIELARVAGPIVDASTLSPDEIARAVAEGRAMVIYVASCMGSRDITVSADLAGAAADLVLARPVPAHLRELSEASWDSREDVYRYLHVECPRVRGRIKRPRAPPRPVFPKVVHEGRGGYISIGGWREYRYPIELIADGRFCIHYPAGNRLRDQAVHLAALEEMCRAEPEKWFLERRDRAGRRP